MAHEIADIRTVSQKILKHVTNYCKRVADMLAALQQILEDAKVSGMPVDVVRKQEELVGEYMESEQELQAVIEKLTQWVERLRER
jgi:F420-0:gamma-glutamyl ligase